VHDDESKSMSTTSEQSSNNSARGRLWVEPVGNIIVARVRGKPTAELIRECQRRVIALRSDTVCSRIMYDALELERPPIDIVLTQQALTDDLRDSGVKIAIVVPNTAIAYLARLAFGEANHRVFYNDISAAVLWLSDRETRPEVPDRRTESLIPRSFQS
jgi:hypothetical protein